MRILMCGDVVGRSGRRVITENLPQLRRQLDLDFVLVNGENAAGGFGITPAICDKFFEAGADVITTGNHVWDQNSIRPYFETERRLLRPHNYPAMEPGSGVGIFRDRSGRRVLVMHFMALLFMPPLEDPFAGVETVLADHRLGGTVDAIVMDFHGEATSEKMAMGHVLDGRVSAVVGTHSHVPTADARIFEGGTAYQSDIGMCGDYDSVIGMRKQLSIARFKDGPGAARLEVARGEGTLCAVFVETDDATGLALRVEPVRLGGHLSPHTPH